MRYALLIQSHANVQYRQCLGKLACREAAALLSSLGLNECIVSEERIAGEDFVVLDAPELTQKQLQVLGSHSGICLMALWDGERLLPLERPKPDFLPESLPYVLKFKGKTNPDFTRMMIHCARGASAFGFGGEALTLYDPMCGKGTTLFCAALEGIHSVGTDLEGAGLREAGEYLERSLKMNRVKHQLQEKSFTLKEGRSARAWDYRMARDSEAAKCGNQVELMMAESDFRDAGCFLKRESVHLIVSDLPYGVQHAPKERKRLSSLEQLAKDAFSACTPLLKIGGVMAFSFNLHTLSKDKMAVWAQESGLKVLDTFPYEDFSHWVEQAVTRDILFCRKESAGEVGGQNLGEA